MTFAPIDWINTEFSNVAMSAFATQNTSGDKVGAENKVRALGKKFKAWNSAVYYAIQYSI